MTTAQRVFAPYFLSYLLLLLVLCGYMAGANAMTYEPRMDEANWKVKASKFECRMEQPIPAFGKAVFSRKAGEQVKFYLNSQASLMAKGLAVVVADSPRWGMSGLPQQLATVRVRSGDRPISIESVLASRLLATLEQGKMPRIGHKARYNNNQGISVGVSSVRFKPAYEQYMNCLAGLLPVNFDQIKRTKVNFSRGQFSLSEASKRTLDRVLNYVKEDKTINSFYVDGHTDNQNSRLQSFELSKQRAEAVTAYLVAGGIAADKITTRFHGERYPIAKNNSKANRSKNRRVTIRLEK